MNMDKLKFFFKNAEEIQNEFSLIPLLYGSLGLEQVLKENLQADDIDILLPKDYVTGPSWPEFRKFLESKGYVLIDEQEHTFEKEGIHYSYATVENLEEFAGIPWHEISLKNDNGVLYKLLNLEQYLIVYEASSKDGYRQQKKNKQDRAKIDLIETKMKNR